MRRIAAPRPRRHACGMRWLLLFAVVGCATSQPAPARRPPQAAAPDPYHEYLKRQVAQAEADIAEAKAKENDPVYVSCAASDSDPCVSLIAAHEALMKTLWDRQGESVNRMKAYEFRRADENRRRAAEPTPFQRAMQGLNRRRPPESPPTPPTDVGPKRMRCTQNALRSDQMDCVEQ